MLIATTTIRRLLWSVPALLAAALPARTWAQSLAGSLTPDVASSLSSEASYASAGVVTRAPVGQDTGVKVGESTLLHLGVGANAGLDTNVFYNDQARVQAPLLQVIPFVQLTNATRGGMVPSGLFFDLGANLQYREYLSDDANITAQRAFNPSAFATLAFSSNRTFSLILSDQFVRSEEPPYIQTTSHITRISNLASVDLRFAPGGGRLQGALRYSNLLDYYESPDLRYANNLGHQFMLDLSWRWLPKTALFVQGTQSIITYTDKDPMNPRSDSFPLRVIGGLRGLITSKLNLTIGAGYAMGSYESGPDPSGLGNVTGVVELGYRATPTTGLLLGYRRDFRNSPVVGNFYDVDTPYLGLRQGIGPFVLSALAKYELRRFQGDMLARTDNFVSASVNGDFFIQSWFYAGLGYVAVIQNVVSDNSPVPAPSYTKHQIFGRVGVVY